MKIDDIVKKIFGGVNRAFSRGYSTVHDGWDIPAPVGTAVRAVRSGTVSYARDARTQTDKGASGWAMGGGNVVNINIGNQLHTQYAHLDRFVVKEGQTVKAGDIIGYVGRTGGKTSSGAYGGPGAQFVGAHLHFGVWDKKLNKMVKPEIAIGDTSTTNEFLETLKKLGISTDPKHVITKSEGAALAEKSSPNTPGMWDIIASRYVGKTVADLQAAANSGEAIGNTPFQNDVVPDVAGALMELGNIAGKLVSYTIAIVLIIAGLFLYARSSSGQSPIPRVPIG